jgi:hypothetical protein
VLISFLGVALWLRWRSGAWKKLDIFKAGHPTEPDAAIEPSIAPAAAPPAA